MTDTTGVIMEMEGSFDEIKSATTTYFNDLEEIAYHRRDHGDKVTVIKRGKGFITLKIIENGRKEYQTEIVTYIDTGKLGRVSNEK